MRCTASILTFVAFLVASTVAADPTVPPEFLELYTAGKFDEAAQLLHCPEHYTSDELQQDRTAIARSLRVFFDAFGPIRATKPWDSGVYVASATGCGTVPYWKLHPDAYTRTLETTNGSGEKGYVVFSFAEVDGRMVLSKFQQGLPASPSAVVRVKDVLKRLMAITNAVPASTKTSAQGIR